MPYVRKYKKRSMRKSRKTYRRYRKFNITKPYQTRYVRITRMSNLDTSNNVHLTILGSAAGNNIGSTVFKMSNVPSSGELIALFDNFCIRKVLYRWVLQRNPDYTSTAGVAGTYPRLTWVHDFNDSTPLGRGALMQYPKMKEYFFGDNNHKTKWYTLKPASLSTLFESGVATAYKPTWGSFVDTQDNDMTHYGIKYAYNQLYEGMILQLEAKLIMDFKGIS